MNILNVAGVLLTIEDIIEQRMRYRCPPSFPFSVYNKPSGNALYPYIVELHRLIMNGAKVERVE